MVEDDGGSGWFGSLTSWLGDKLSGLTEGLAVLFQPITEGINTIISAVKNIPSLLSDVWETIKGLPEKIIGGFKDALVFLFVPDEGFLDGKIDYITSKFGFIGTVKDTVDVFINYIDNTNFNEAPAVTLNLSSAKSSYDYGQRAVAISMEWYQPYKSTGDTIISAVIWLVFLWNVFTGLPSLISGFGGGMRAAAEVGKAQEKG